MHMSYEQFEGCRTVNKCYSYAYKQYQSMIWGGHVHVLVVGVHFNFSVKYR